ncbi:hypothetical protein CRUP_033576 [Coryphaenoides rupestris]|nr:hypothetical protein CRUP_033576 [Coryphaenoides rupestris]
MITRRRSVTKRNEVQPLEVEVTDAVEMVDNPPSPHDDIEGTDLELEDLFGADDLKWTLDKDTSSSLFDIGLTDLGVYNMQDDDSMFEASTSPSPERYPYGARSKKTQNRCGSMVNKNAIAARLNRLKKKEYVNALEKKAANSNDNDHDYALPRKRIKVEEKETSGGVCLHVDKNHVSVEFCTKCAASASASLKIFLLGNG